MKGFIKLVVLNSFIFSLILFGCSQQSAKVSYSKDDVVLEKYNWRGDVPEKKHVKVVNYYGNISTRTTKQNDIEMAGIIQRVGTAAPDPEVKIIDNNGITEIEIVYNAKTVDAYNNRIARFDLGIYVPKGVTLEMVTSFGDIKSKKHHSNLIARSESGHITMATHGIFDARSESGNIKANLLSWQSARFEVKNKQRQYLLSSKSGDIDVFLADSNQLEITAEAGGGIYSSDEEFERLMLGENRQTLEMQVDGAERKLSVRSTQGRLTIHPRLSQAESIAEPQSFDGDIRDLPKADTWKPGDPVTEMQDGRSEKNHVDSKNDGDSEKSLRRRLPRKKHQ